MITRETYHLLKSAKEIRVALVTDGDNGRPFIDGARPQGGQLRFPVTAQIYHQYVRQITNTLERIYGAVDDVPRTELDIRFFAENLLQARQRLGCAAGDQNPNAIVGKSFHIAPVIDQFVFQNFIVTTPLDNASCRSTGAAPFRGCSRGFRLAASC